MYEQLTVWDELVEQARELPAKRLRLLAGMLSHLALLEDDHLVRVGVVARREKTAATKRHAEPQAAGWGNLLDACLIEYLRRHPRPAMIAP